MGKRRGNRVASGYALLCLLIQTMDLLRFNQFVSTTLTPGLSASCLRGARRGGVRAAYGSGGRPRGPIVFFAVVVAVVGIAWLLPKWNGSIFPVLYDGMSPFFQERSSAPYARNRAFGAGAPHVAGKTGRLGRCAVCGGVVILSSLIQATSVGVLGDFSGMVLFPYYTAVTAAQVSILQRLDIVAAAVWLAALLIKTAFIGVLYLHCVGRMLGDKARLPAAVAGGAAVTVAGLFLGGFILQQERWFIWIVSAVLLGIFAVLLPLILTAAVGGGVSVSSGRGQRRRRYEKGSRVGSIGLLFVLIIAVALLPSCRERPRSTTGWWSRPSGSTIRKGNAAFPFRRSRC
ncbi:MAG: hypothetical protein ACLTTU_11000 [Bilophila wadsworthia]